MQECEECSVPLIMEEDISLPKRDPRTHKGDYGRILLVGGSTAYPGSINLTSRAAVRAGAGLVFLAVPESIWSVCAVKNEEAMPRPFPCDAEGRLSAEALPPLRALWDGCRVLAVGPGLGRSPDTKEIVEAVLREFPGIILLDADALWALSETPEWLLEAAGRTVVTPHEGEFARLGGAVTGRRVTDARCFAEKYRCATVLKGFGTVVAFPDGEKHVIAAGNPGMAKGGSGDVLTGVLAALAGQLPLRQAVITGAWVHSAAGDRCAEEKGEYGMTPMDIVERIPYIMKKVTR